MKGEWKDEGRVGGRRGSGRMKGEWEDGESGRTKGEWEDEGRVGG